MAPGVQGDDPIVGGERLHLVLKIGVVLSVSVEQDQGEALPLLLVVQRDIHVLFLSPYVTKPCGAFLLFQRPVFNRGSTLITGSS